MPNVPNGETGKICAKCAKWANLTFNIVLLKTGKICAKQVQDGVLMDLGQSPDNGFHLQAFLKMVGYEFFIYYSGRYMVEMGVGSSGFQKCALEEIR
ncbi:MAG: hypothetical protein HQL63_01210 [Magnetococcales bacterium]|nr:hypothetical protein [Magnetococcales bacterium]MBF0321511.1 hypothetical protein [Magnetococcales bacterium]